MIKEGKFGVHEAICLVTLSIANKVYSTAPGYLTRSVGTAGWYMTLISCVLAIVFFSFLCLLLKRFPGKNIVEIYDASLGRAIGFVFSLVLMMSFLVSTGIFTREFVDELKIYTFPQTPSVILIGAFIIVVAISSFLGLESIARVAKLIAYFALFIFLLMFILASEYFKFSNIFPILGNGLAKTVTTGILRSSAYAEVVVLAVFAGSLQGISHIKKAGYASLFISGFLLSIGLLCFSMVFEYKSSEEVTAPMYVMVRLIKYGNFLERIDPIYLFMWITTTIIYISILFYSTVSIFCKMFRLQDARPIIIPMAVIVFAVSILPRDFPSVISEYIQPIRTYGNISFFVLPLLALIVAVFRKKKGEKLNA